MIDCLLTFVNMIYQSSYNIKYLLMPKANFFSLFQNKIKVVALKITSNINTLIKDLFHSPPAYKASITLSWKPITVRNILFCELGIFVCGHVFICILSKLRT